MPIRRSEPAAASRPSAAPSRRAAPVRGGRVSRCVVALLMLPALLTLDACKKKKEEAETIAPPPAGGASLEIVQTGIGAGVALDSALAPTSTQWEQVFVLDDTHAVVVGRSLDVAIALRTDDGGRSWVALKADAGDAHGWGVGADGALVLATGRRAKPAAKGKPAPIEKVQLFFAGPLSSDLTGPVALLPAEGKLKGATPALDALRPVPLSGDVAALVVAFGPRRLALAYGAPAGKAVPEPSPLAPGEDVVPVAYGHPPSLLSIKAGALTVRPWPGPGEPLGAGSPIPGFRADASSLRQLSEGPACHSGGWSFQRIVQPPGAATLVGIGPNRAFAVKLPPGELALLGCTGDAVVLQGSEEKTGAPLLVRCALDGKCSSPKSAPFRIWPEKHDRTVRAVPTAQGVVAALSAHTGSRWGLYLGQSLDQGQLFELPRVIGEGTSDRGVFELGALIALPKRVLMLVSSDVTGTTRRGWYSLASDDGGTNWGPP
jgi:hypothetical protein